MERYFFQKYKILRHGLFWFASMSLTLFFFLINEHRLYFNLILFTKIFVINLGFAIGVYVNLYLLIPVFLKEKKYIYYIFWLIFLLTLASIFIQLLIFPIRKPLHLEDSFKSFNSNLHSALFFVILIYVAATTFLKFLKEWFSIQDLNYRLAKIEKQKIEAELNTLKSQLNPHFLFNSLNNIYSLALSKSEKVPEYILRLSDLMRHIIYDSRENFIPFERELEFIKNFIALRQIRLNDQTNIQMEIKGEISGAKVAPLLFEPFIDNAFKHGLPNTGPGDFIWISFDFNFPGYLEFSIKNNTTNYQLPNTGKAGIGIDNVKQRLQLLYGEKEYLLRITEKDQIYHVYLKLKLK